MGIPFLGFGNPWTRRWAAMGFTGGIVRGSVATFSGGISQQQARLRSPLANRGRTDGVAFTTRLAGPIGLQGNYVTALTHVAPQAQRLISGFSTLLPHTKTF